MRREPIGAQRLRLSAAAYAGSRRAPARRAAPTRHIALMVDHAVPASPAAAEPRHLSVVLAMLAAALVIAALYFGRDIFVPLALAALLGFLLDPLVTRLRRWRLPRWLAVGIVVAVTIGVVAVTSLFAGSQLVALAREVPTYQSTIQSKLRDLRETMSKRGAFDGAARLFDMFEGELSATRRALQRTPPASPGAAPAQVQAQAQQRAQKETPPLRVQLEEPPLRPIQALGEVIAPVLAPLLTAGLVFVFLVFILLGRNELRDRLLRLTGGDVNRMSDALNEAAERVSRYLGAQFLVNLGYALPMAAGLWLIGVPGALLWGLLAGALRFLPYLGPAIAAVFPLTMAFAVDPGWNMLLWTLALVATLELISNNLIEPWAYGSSTGLSPLAVLVSATFWTVVWGSIGLVLATPITVCLVVLGRHVRPLRIFDLLLGNEPAFDVPTTLYQRLLAGEVEDAVELAREQVDEGSVAAFYAEAALPALLLTQATPDAERRERVADGMQVLLDDLDEAPADSDRKIVAAPRLLCIGGQSALDSIAAEMLARTLSGAGHAATVKPAADLSPRSIDTLDLTGIDAVFVGYLAEAWRTRARYVCRHLRRRGTMMRTPARRRRAHHRRRLAGRRRVHACRDGGGDRRRCVGHIGRAGLAALARSRSGDGRRAVDRRTRAHHAAGCLGVGCLRAAHRGVIRHTVLPTSSTTSSAPHPQRPPLVRQRPWAGAGASA
jgi:predicted PurR-regulated permease PerM